MDFNEEFCEILKAYTGAERIVSVDAEPLRRAVIALRQCAAKVLRDAKDGCVQDYFVSLRVKFDVVPKIPLMSHEAWHQRVNGMHSATCDVQNALERRAKEIEGGE